MSAPKLRFYLTSSKWNKKPIISLADYVDYRGKTPKKTESGVFLVTAKNIKQGYIDYESSQEFIDSSEYNEVMRRGKPKIGDVLITTEAPLGNVASIDREDIALAQRVIKYRGKDNVLNSHFLKQLFLSPNFQTEICSKATGGTVQGIKGSVLHQINIYTPNFDEQTKIADFLSSVDEKITLLNKQYILLCQYKKGMMQKIFSQEVRFNDENEEEFPEWESKQLSEIAIVNPKNKAIPSEFIYIDLESVENGKLLKEQLISKDDAPSRAQRLLAPGDVLFQLVRPYQKNNYIFLLDGDYVASTGYAQLRAKYNSSFLYQLLHLESFTSEVMNRCTGTSYPAINSSDLASIEVEIPCKKEQTKIANFLSALDDKIFAKKAELDNLKTWKQGLLQQMFV